MTYLISGNSAENNFQLIANGVRTTKEAFEAQQKFDEKGFEKKIKEQLAVTICLIASAIFCYQKEMMVALTVVTCGAIYAVIKLKIIVEDQAYYQRKLDKVFESVNTIYRNVIVFIDEKRKAKEEWLKKAIPSFITSCDNNNFLSKFQYKANEYDRIENKNFSDLNQSIRGNSETIPQVSKEIWQNFKNACNEYANCSDLYRSLPDPYTIMANIMLRR